MFNKGLTIIFSLFFFGLFLVGCATQPKIQILSGPKQIDRKGEILSVQAKPGDDLQEVILKNNGDKAVIPFSTLVDFHVAIDTSSMSIMTHFNNRDRTITYEVISKMDKVDIVFDNLCDIFIIPDPLININLIDNYNASRINKKKYKIILVPIFNGDCTVSGYLLRYDLKGVSHACPSYKRIKQIENSFRNCKGSNCPCRKPSNCNCKEYRIFGICCP